MAKSEPARRASARWKCCDSRRVYDGKLFQVDVEDVRLPSGRESVREIVRHPGAVALVVVDHGGAAAAGAPVPRGRRTGSCWKSRRARARRAKTPEACARREMQEETGYPPARVERLGGFYSAPGFCTEYLDCYLCTDLRTRDLRPEEDEDLSLERLSVAEAWAGGGARRDHRRQDAGGPAALRGAQKRRAGVSFEF